MQDKLLSCEFYHSIYTVLLYIFFGGGGGGSEYLFYFLLNFIL